MSLEPATYLALSKPRITAMVVLTAALSFFFGRSIDPADAIHPAEVLATFWLVAALCLGTAMLSAGASAINMWMERDLDARMERTRVRPLPAGRIRPRYVALFGVLIAGAGAGLLYWEVGRLTAALGIATFLTYILVYTPLKTRTPWNTHVGTIPGALPVLMGYAAARGAIEAPGVALFGVLLLWQLPHFFAINWLYREEYRAAGYKMMATADETGLRLAIESVVFAGALLLISLSPPLLHSTGWLYQVVALIVGCGFIKYVVRFARLRTQRRARATMLASIVYLPAVLFALLADRLLAGRVFTW